MKRQLHRVLLSLAVACPFLLPNIGWGATGPALIVNDGTPGFVAGVTSNLSSKLVTAGYTVTTSVGVPGGSLSGYKQIWDIRFNNTTPLTAGDMAAYFTYLVGGGSLFLMGENTAFVTRDSSILTFVAQAGGGMITVTDPNNTQTVLPPFTGPNAVTTIAFLGAGGSPSPGSGAYVTKDGTNIGAALVWGPRNLANAPNGSLIVVYDVNFMDPGADANSQALLANMIGYLAGPSVVAPPTTPVPPAILLTLLGLGIVGGLEVRRRRQPVSRAEISKVAG